ncbi:hypothetical protein HNP46_002194 [Pseudomonas nitritireducens]|uniref:Uncharacterized protein n=1 Tax=Pseudomonas nitroreducens TaxID=46680 RepID=A0A7W7P1J4_PSENT|nr:hypothetical protein [Pseudomonas nitritireducens]MBB4863347.1 hypothetical protein [Pseudomonas nitritireducens]
MAGAGSGASMVEALVAQGRTVVGDDGGKVQAGKPVKVSRRDFKRLVELGFLVDPDNPEPATPSGQGPGVIATEGPTVRLAQ